MHQLRKEWSDEHIAFYKARASRAMHGHSRQRELVEEFLSHIGVHGDSQGRPIHDLRGWARRQNVKTLRELITGFEFAQLAEREARARRPNGPGIVGRRYPHETDKDRQVA